MWSGGRRLFGATTVLLLISTLASPGVAAQRDQPSSSDQGSATESQQSTGGSDHAVMLDHLVIDTLEPLTASNRRAERAALAAALEVTTTETATSETTTAETGTVETGGDTDPLDPETQTPSIPELGPVEATDSGKIRLCFRDDVPQPVRTEALAAAAQWDKSLRITGPVVEIDFYWLDLARPNVLGAAGPTKFVLNPGLPKPQARYPVALANELLGIDHMPRDSCGTTEQGEIVLVLNSGAGSNSGGWIAGDRMLDEALDRTEATDLQTTILHELAHGFGFIGSAELDEGEELAWPSDDNTPLIYDLFARRCLDETFTGCAFDRSTHVEVGDLEAVTSGRLWIDTGLGPLLELEAPHRWDAGSSFSHFDEYRYPLSSPYSLMTPYIDAEQRVRSVDAATEAVMQQIGWTLGRPGAPITEVAVTAGPNQVQINLLATNLDAGPPPRAYELLIYRVESDAAGALSRVLAYQPLEGSTRLATIEGLANEAVYQVEVKAKNSADSEGSVLSGPVLPLVAAGGAERVDEVYKTLIGREPTTQERAAFSLRVTQGGLQGAVNSVFVRPEVYEQQVVVRLYLGYLGRTPDLGGLRYWTDRLTLGGSLVDLAEDFAASTTFETGQVLDDVAFVEEVYRSVLDREAEPEGLAYWSGLLGAGESRGRVLIEISESVEHRAATPDLPGFVVAYLLWKDRLPSPDEVELWFPSIERDGIGEQLVSLAVDAIPVVQSPPAIEPTEPVEGETEDLETEDRGDETNSGLASLTLAS